MSMVLLNRITPLVVTQIISQGKLLARILWQTKSSRCSYYTQQGFNNIAILKALLTYRVVGDGRVQQAF